jgi:SAM-dependent methyltransferase
MTFVNTEQAEYWAGRAASWASMEAHHERIIGPAGAMAMDRLNPRPGQMIVDLGCGTGLTTVELARRVAPSGRVLGADISSDLLDRARQHAVAAGLENVDFQHADVQSSDLGQSRFDGAYSRFGVMFFADPVAAFTNVRAALKTGGVLSFACWQPVAANEWMLLPALAAASALGTLPEAPPPDAPGPFSLGDPERTGAILASSGFHDVEIAGHADTLEVAEDQIPPWVEAALSVGAVQRMLEGAGDDDVRRIKAAIDEAMRSRLRSGIVELGRAFFLVRAES